MVAKIYRKLVLLILYSQGTKMIDPLNIYYDIAC